MCERISRGSSCVRSSGRKQEGSLLLLFVLLFLAFFLPIVGDELEAELFFCRQLKQKYEINLFVFVVQRTVAKSVKRGFKEINFFSWGRHCIFSGKTDIESQRPETAVCSNVALYFVRDSIPSVAPAEDINRRFCQSLVASVFSTVACCVACGMCRFCCQTEIQWTLVCHRRLQSVCNEVLTDTLPGMVCVVLMLAILLIPMTAERTIEPLVAFIP